MGDLRKKDSERDESPQDAAFEKWFSDKKRSTYSQMIDQMGEERARVVCREAWYAALNHNEVTDSLPQRLERLRMLEAADQDPVRLLTLLAGRGGAEGALGEAGLLFMKKGQDYGTHGERDDYFPFGLQSYAQMLWVKALRLVSLAKAPRETNFEGVRDTLLDLISYSCFAADWLKRGGRRAGT
jgi:hypothetical protein